jgi:DNA-binding beta-propeller fold protein YncE
MKRTWYKMSVPMLAAIMLAGCSGPFASEKAVDAIAHGSLLYANYSYGKYSINAMNPTTLEVTSKIEIAKGWGSDIFQDKKGRVWCPVFYQPDMTNMENFVEVFDPATGNRWHVEVGQGPRQVVFADNGAYVVCEEDGDNPTIYFVDDQLKATKWKTVEHGGLISGVQFDGSAIYWSSLRNDAADPTKDVPMLVKVPLQGDVAMQPLSDAPKGFNSLSLQNGKLYLGLEEKEGTISEYDAPTMKRTRILPYTDMVGEFDWLADNQVAVTNFSKRQQSGNKITVFDVTQGKEVRSFDAKVVAGHVTHWQDHYYVVDNQHTKMELLKDDGTSEKVVDAPTQVTNLVWYP